jgi:hypothetical protein
MLAEHGQEMPEAGSPLLHRQLIVLHDITDYERINNSKRSSLFRNHALLKEAFVKAGGGGQSIAGATRTLSLDSTTRHNFPRVKPQTKMHNHQTIPNDPDGCGSCM